MTGGGAMPLLLVDTGAGWALRAPCGAETVALLDTTPDTLSPIARAARHLPAEAAITLRPDVSPTAVMQLALHTARCTPCQTRVAELLHLMKAAAIGQEGRPALL